ncbi:MAG: hypothetical protein ABWX57_09270 [Aeromicrobium sp.]
MHPILTVERTALTGHRTIHHLRCVQRGLYQVAEAGGRAKTRDLRANSAREAVARSAVLRRIDGSDATRIHVADWSAIDRGDLLDVLRPTVNASDLGAVEIDDDTGHDPFESWPHDLDAAARRWATWHRVEVDGRPVYGVRTGSGRVVLVDGDSPERPFDRWTELLATWWDSATYSAVGMAGYGVDGLYLVRPGLLATVRFDDEDLTLRLERVSKRASAYALVRSRVTRVVYSDRHRAQLVLAAHGLEAAAIEPGDGLTSSLTGDELRRLLRGRRPPDGPAIRHGVTVEP